MGIALLAIAGFIALLAGVVALGALILMVCWNAVVPTLFHGPQMSFLTAVAASFLLNIIGNAFRSTSGK